MKLIDNWKRTLTHGYSAWCIYISIAVHFAQEALPYLGEVIPWWASIGVLGAALALRIVKQGAVSGADDE